MGSPDLRRITEEVARHPAAWRSFRQAMRDEFDTEAARYDERLGPDHLEPLRAALGLVGAPGRALDVGCGTGVAADLLAEVFPSAFVVGVDLAPRMIEVGATKRRERPVRFVVGDAASLPFGDGALDLVVSVAVPVFARELARVLAPGGMVAVTFPLGDATPIFLAEAKLGRVLRAAGLADIRHGRAGRGTLTLARKA